MDVFAHGATHENAGQQIFLLARFSAMEHCATFKQRHVHETARLIAGCRLQETWQKGGTHVAHLAGDRVFQLGCIATSAKQLSRSFVDEAVRHTFVVAQCRRRAACDLFTFLHRRQDLFRNTSGSARQWLALELGQRRDTRHFFHQIGRATHIWAPAWDVCHVAFDGEAKCFQRGHLSFGRDFHADERLHTVGVQLIGPGYIRHGARSHDVGWLTAAEIDDHLCSIIHGLHVVGRIDAAFVTVARVGIDFQTAARVGDLDVIPNSGFKKDIGGFFGTAGG
mmetsp:Transcript_27847/g.51987  ORF Transcript_27847/g.51987 Transcript_27847/m.51987 type:complete len:280 (+) Transcript_27847:645-1484(+)